jgi:predicted KAP-like P-loop ATPase
MTHHLEKEESPVQILKRKMMALLPGFSEQLDDLFDDALANEMEMVSMAYHQGWDDAFDEDDDGAVDAGEVYYKMKYGQ